MTGGLTTLKSNKCGRRNFFWVEGGVTPPWKEKLTPPPSGKETTPPSQIFDLVHLWIILYADKTYFYHEIYQNDYSVAHLLPCILHKLNDISRPFRRQEGEQHAIEKLLAWSKHLAFPSGMTTPHYLPNSSTPTMAGILSTPCPKVHWIPGLSWGYCA